RNLAIGGARVHAVLEQTSTQARCEVVAQAVRTRRAQAQPSAGGAELPLHVEIGQREKRLLVNLASGTALELSVKVGRQRQHPIKPALAGQKQSAASKEMVTGEMVISDAAGADQFA